MDKWVKLYIFIMKSSIYIINEQICLILYEFIFKKDIILIFQFSGNKIVGLFFSKPLEWNETIWILFEFLTQLHTSLLEENLSEKNLSFKKTENYRISFEKRKICLGFYMSDLNIEIS